MGENRPPMTHRERVLAALNHREPDRVPIDLGGSRDSSMHVDAHRKLKAHLGIESPDVLSDRMMQCVLIDEAVLERFDVDTRVVVPGSADNGPDIELDQFSYRDEWGVVRVKPPGSLWYDLRGSPLAGEITLRDILQYPWPDPDDPGRVRGVRQHALSLKRKGDYALILNLAAGIVHVSQYLRGFQDWYMDMAADRALIGALMDAILEVTMPMARNLLLEVGDLADIVLGGDDLGTQRGLQISPATYREVIKPRHARFYRQVRELCPHAKIALHSCGSIYPILGDLVEVGIDLLNPVQVSANDMDPSRLKREFGDRLSFWGGIDTQKVLPHGSVDDVRAEVRRRIAEMGSGGGYILAAVHNIQPEVPVENVVAMFDHAREVGAYS